MPDTAAFLLSFCSEEEAFNIWSHFIEKILPPQFYLSRMKGERSKLGRIGEEHLIDKYCRHIFAITNLIENFYNENFLLNISDSIVPLLVTANLPAETILFIWKEMLKDTSVWAFFLVL